MGQYFLAYVRDKNKKRGKTFISSCGGLKLTEHSWVGNDFMQGVCKKIHNKPSYVYWVGDYFDPSEDEAKSEMSSDCVSVDFASLWRKKNAKELQDTFDISDKYLVNHDLKVYVNMCDYIDMLTCGKTHDKDWVQHPLSLLTAISNGKGGGDYDVEGLNADSIGVWKGCLLEITDNIPKDYIDVTEDVLFDDDI